MTANNAESPVLADFTRVLEELRPRQDELDKQKTVLRDQEHKFVAERTIQGATQMATASCDVGNRISDCRRFSMKGTWCVPGGDRTSIQSSSAAWNTSGTIRTLAVM